MNNDDAPLRKRLEDAIRQADPNWSTAPLLREAAELARRVEGSEIVAVRAESMPGHGGGNDVYTIGSDYDPDNPMKRYVGRRLRLLPVDG